MNFSNYWYKTRAQNIVANKTSEYSYTAMFILFLMVCANTIIHHRDRFLFMLGTELGTIHLVIEEDLLKRWVRLSFSRKSRVKCTARNRRDVTTARLRRTYTCERARKQSAKALDALRACMRKGFVKYNNYGMPLDIE